MCGVQQMWMHQWVQHLWDWHVYAFYLESVNRLCAHQKFCHRKQYAAEKTLWGGGVDFHQICYLRSISDVIMDSYKGHESGYAQATHNVLYSTHPISSIFHNPSFS